MKIHNSLKSLLGLLLLLATLTHTHQAQQNFDYPTANLSTSWTNSPSLPHSVSFTDGSTVRAILLRGSYGPRFACGFYCKGDCKSFLFAVFIVQTNSASGITSPAIGFPQVVWSANPNRPVGENATLSLTWYGDLLLQDSDGTIVWSTKTLKKPVKGMSINNDGNLVLFDWNGKTVWQSFDHPTDVLVPGQTLTRTQKLTSAEHSLTVTSNGLFATIGSNPPQTYFQYPVSKTKYAKFTNGSLDIYAESNKPVASIALPKASSAQYMKLDSDGHLRVYEWSTKGWVVVADVFGLKACLYPKACGEYGICADDGQCSCPIGTSGCYSFFRPVNYRRPSLGCSTVTPISCRLSGYHQMIAIEDVSYFGYSDARAVALKGVDKERCKQACLKSCACRAALFQYGSDPTKGYCYLPSKVYSMIDNRPEVSHYNSTAFLKVQVKPIKA
ncbi:G-type lectin S-receptor-like serine/threonine-protein kinase [Acorus gramineus]|uniref:G-type lectin S-receptor-like serine/threonine-protein kinase n=1 Tax=Acorus gramineus TaxID=55184 RepID=A0AAV9BF90_ACOGR|nr:G-type lectin S-receptor-like serine/threonine-protein kinase [Acorus gramineus]